MSDLSNRPEIVTFPVLWTGWMRDPFDCVRVLGERDGKLVVMTSDGEIMADVDSHKVIPKGTPEGDDRTLAPRCRDCGHFFDPSDGRAFVHVPSERYPDLGHACPACHQMARSAEAWAVWNGCQGVFTDQVYHRKDDALTAMKEEPEVYEAVVPVRVIVEPKTERELREWRETQLRGEVVS